MSLISDALKKAQQERDKDQPFDEHHTEPLQADNPFPKKRLIFYGGLIAVIIVAVLAVTVFYKPQSKPTMQALNVRSGSETPTKQPPTEQPQPQQPQQPQETPPPTGDQTENQSENVAEPVSKPVEKTNEPVIKKKDSPVPSPVKKETVTPKVFKPKKSKPKAIDRKPIRETTPKPKSQIKSKPVPKPESTTPPMETGLDEFIAKGDLFLTQNKPHLAAEEYKQALKMGKSIKVYLKLYYAFKAMKNTVLSRAYIDDGLKHFPKEFYLNKISAILYIRARQYRQALVNIDTAINTNDTDYAVYTYRGLCNFHLKNYTPALKDFQKSLSLNSDALENYYYTALIFDNLKQYEKALEYYTAFYKLNPQGKNFKHHNWVTRRIKLLQQNTNQ
jgi:hypothetical protein